MKEKPVVAFQGEKGAYSEMAARLYFKSSIEVKACRNFEDVFRFASGGGRCFGIIPIENSLTGSIHENYDLLLHHQVCIIGEIKLRISHALIALPSSTLFDIRAIYSHPQAIAQCRKYLRRRKGVEIIPAYDTAGSVRMIREKGLKNAAAIASIQAAIDYKMRVLAKNLESNKANYTRFLVLGASRVQAEKNCKTSIVFSAKNVPGALFKCLAVFAMRDIDLLKIESRPIHGKPWAYLFYLDFSGRSTGEKEKNALHHLREITLFSKILGSYPVGSEVEPQYRIR